MFVKVCLHEVIYEVFLDLLTFGVIQFKPNDNMYFITHYHCFQESLQSTIFWSRPLEEIHSHGFDHAHRETCGPCPNWLLFSLHRVDPMQTIGTRLVGSRHRDLKSEKPSPDSTEHRPDHYNPTIDAIDGKIHHPHHPIAKDPWSTVCAWSASMLPTSLDDSVVVSLPPHYSMMMKLAKSSRWLEYVVFGADWDQCDEVPSYVVRWETWKQCRTGASYHEVTNLEPIVLRDRFLRVDFGSGCCYFSRVRLPVPNLNSRTNNNSRKRFHDHTGDARENNPSDTKTLRTPPLIEKAIMESIHQ